jgi:DNA polymerase elongation subunit (family B)
VDVYASEEALLGALCSAVLAADPDILLGYEVQRGGLGYCAERAAALGLPSLLRAMSRLPRVRGQGRCLLVRVWCADWAAGLGRVQHMMQILSGE